MHSSQPQTNSLPHKSSDAETIWAPKPAQSDKPSFLYAAAMAKATLGVSAHFLLDATLKGASVKLADSHIEKFWRALLDASHTTLIAHHRSRVNFNQSYVFMSNHVSLLDIPVLFGAIPQSLRMVTKEELFRVPVFGQALDKSGFIPVDRKNRKKAIHQLESAKQKLREGVSIWIAPEGTRSRSLELGSFKKGGFHIALGLGIPIVPLWIEGSAEVVFPDSLNVRPNQKVSVYFGEPIQSAGLGLESLEEFMQRVRQSMIALRPSHSTEKASI